MAIQDFVNGGFIGKLGQLIGARRHGKRIVYPYFIPTDPKTPNQQKIRGEFANCSLLAKLGLNFSGHSGFILAGTSGEYQNRIKYAMQFRLNRSPNWEGLYLTPLTESGFGPTNLSISLDSSIKRIRMLYGTPATPFQPPQFQVIRLLFTNPDGSESIYEDTMDFVTAVNPDDDNYYYFDYNLEPNQSLTDFRIHFIYNAGKYPAITAEYIYADTLIASDYSAAIWNNLIDLHEFLQYLYLWGRTLVEARTSWLAAQNQSSRYDPMSCSNCIFFNPDNPGLIQINNLTFDQNSHTISLDISIPLNTEDRVLYVYIATYRQDTGTGEHFLQTKIFTFTIQANTDTFTSNFNIGLSSNPYTVLNLGCQLFITLSRTPTVINAISDQFRII